MPIYEWYDSNTEKEVSVLRKFDDYQEPPTEAEADEFTKEEYDNAEWVRRIGVGIKVTRGDSWGAGKGYWMRRGEF